MDMPLLSEPDALPAPDAALVLWQSSMTALIQTLGPKKGERFLRAMAASMAEQQSLSELVPIRRSAVHAELATARRNAAAYFGRWIPTFIAALPR